jgi:hypothetical protein
MLLQQQEPNFVFKIFNNTKQSNKQTNVHDDDQHPLIFSNSIIQCHPRYMSSHSKTTLHQKEKESTHVVLSRTSFLFSFPLLLSFSLSFLPSSLPSFSLYFFFKISSFLSF